MIRKFYILFLILSCGIVLFGCGEKPQPVRRVRTKVKKAKKQVEVVEETKTPPYIYKGGQYRSPFSPAGRGAPTRFVAGPAAKITVNPDSLKVTGVFEDKRDKYAILSGIGEFYIIKKGRLYNEDEFEVPGIAAVIKKNKVILITGENDIYELPIPE